MMHRRQYMTFATKWYASKMDHIHETMDHWDLGSPFVPTSSDKLDYRFMIAWA